MKITKEQKEAIEYLEKYTKWETYGERNLEKDIITIINLVKKLQKENEELEEINNELEAEKNEAIRRYNFETISIKKVKDKLKKLEIENEKAKGRKDNLVERYTIEQKMNTLQELLKESEE